MLEVHFSSEVLYKTHAHTCMHIICMGSLRLIPICQYVYRLIHTCVAISEVTWVLICQRQYIECIAEQQQYSGGM